MSLNLTNKKVALDPTVVTTKGGVKLQSAPHSFSFLFLFFLSFQLKSLSMFQRFCAPSTQNHLQQPKSETGSHRLALEQAVSRSKTSRPSSKSQVFSTWHEQVRAWLCQNMMKFGSWNTKSKFGLRSESGTQLYPLLQAKSNCSTSWNPNTTVLWVA